MTARGDLVAEADAPTPPRRRGWRRGLLIGAAAVLLVLTAVVFYGWGGADPRGRRRPARPNRPPSRR